REAEKGFSLKLESADDEISAGAFLQQANRHAEALPFFEKGLSLEPDSITGSLGYGLSLNALQRNEKALEQFDKAAPGSPDDKKVIFNRSLAALCGGRFREGWQGYDRRLLIGSELQIPGFPPIPRWDGKEIPEKLLVWGEQGIGDQILYTSIITDLKKRVE